MQSYEIIRSQAVKFKMSDRRLNKNLVMIQPEIRSAIDSFKFYNIDKFIKSGEEATRKAIPKIKSLINN